MPQSHVGLIYAFLPPASVLELVLQTSRELHFVV